MHWEGGDSHLLLHAEEASWGRGSAGAEVGLGGQASQGSPSQTSRVPEGVMGQAGSRSEARGDSWARP